MKTIYILIMCAIQSLTLSAQVATDNTQWSNAIAYPTPTTIAGHPWQGRRVAYLGDSITDPRHKAAKRKYWGLLEDWLGITPWVYGVSGRQWNDIPRQLKQLQTEHGDSVDAIIIFIGTNDFNAAIPIGEWFTEQEEEVEAAVHAPRAITHRIRRHAIMSDSTYRGRINKALMVVKEAYPTKQVILMTPLHRAYASFSDTNIQPDESYRNACGEYIDSYIESVIQAGRIWSVPVIDTNGMSGLYPLMPEYSIYFKDKEKDLLHPNEYGHWRLAMLMYYQLSVLPVF